MADVIWLIPALPLAGFVVLMLLGRRIGEPRAGWLATLTVTGSFVLSVITWFDMLSKPAEERAMHQVLFTWLPAGNFSVDLGFLADQLSITMALFITGISALIHLYSIGYMSGDENFSKFFVYLNLFVGSMLMLVLGDNLLVTFLGWEGVGACSYLLVSFWFTDPANATAGKKAFVANRVGDVGFLLGTFLVWLTFGGIGYDTIDQGAHNGIASTTAIAIVLLFFLGATGKSAQIPLFTWLPDAMAGPTPVSALIHAATMVTSGVFLLTRLNPVLSEAGWANDVIAWVGLATSLVAALAALAQKDIKKVLAYSTVSQLGYMILAIGSGAFVAAIFHMITHAFFKALLFLGSGSVILAMGHEQDMRLYGRLRRYLPITSGAFIVGWLAISGIPPFSGFWSKDEILGAVWQNGPTGKLMWAVGVFVAVLTAFYMTRLVVKTFFGPEEKWRNPEAYEEVPDLHHRHLDPEHTPREPAWTMLAPLVVLAVAAAVGGIINLPIGNLDFLGRWLEPVIAHPHEALPGGTAAILATIAALCAIGGLAAAWKIYSDRKAEAARKLVEQSAFEHALYIDDAYTALVGGPGEAAATGLATFDREVIDGAVNGAGWLARASGRVMRTFQNGFVRSYALALAGGAVVLLVFVVIRMGF
ncbi:MAG: NADH-quinone oxidoreductase subunit L [Microthrixaceae bacterium]